MSMSLSSGSKVANNNTARSSIASEVDAEHEGSRHVVISTFVDVGIQVANAVSASSV